MGIDHLSCHYLQTTAVSLSRSLFSLYSVIKYFSLFPAAYNKSMGDWRGTYGTCGVGMRYKSGMWYIWLHTGNSHHTFRKNTYS